MRTPSASSGGMVCRVKKLAEEDAGTGRRLGTSKSVGETYKQCWFYLAA